MYVQCSFLVYSNNSKFAVSGGTKRQFVKLVCRNCLFSFGWLKGTPGYSLNALLK